MLCNIHVACLFIWSLQLLLFSGPWFVGEVIEDHIGVVFAWGTFVNKSFLPGSLTYAYGFFQVRCLHCTLSELNLLPRLCMTYTIQSFTSTVLSLALLRMSNTY